MQSRTQNVRFGVWLRFAHCAIATGLTSVAITSQSGFDVAILSESRDVPQPISRRAGGMEAEVSGSGRSEDKDSVNVSDGDRIQSVSSAADFS